MIPIIVPCSCPGKPHAEDTVSIPGVLDARLGAAGTYAIQFTPGIGADMEGAITDAWLHNAPRAWTFIDAEGKPLPITIENIDARLTWANGGMEVAEKANELYAGDLFSPLARRKPKPSRRGRTGNSTSATPPSGSDPESPSSLEPSLRTVTGGRRSGAKAS